LGISSIDSFLDHISDDKWHNLDELGEKTRMSQQVVYEIATFLSQYGFIEFDKDKFEVILLEDSRRILSSHD